MDDPSKVHQGPSTTFHNLPMQSQSHKSAGKHKIPQGPSTDPRTASQDSSAITRPGYYRLLPPLDCEHGKFHKSLREVLHRVQRAQNVRNCQSRNQPKLADISRNQPKLAEITRDCYAPSAATHRNVFSNSKTYFVDPGPLFALTAIAD